MNKRGNIVVIAIIFLALLGIGIFVAKDRIKRQFFKPTASKTPVGVQLTTSTQSIAEDLDIPWEMAFLPDGDMLVTERTGVLKRIGHNNQTHTVDGVQHTGEGGLLGLALHPDFSKNHLLYLYLTTKNGEGLINRVDRYHYNNDKLSDKTTIISNIPGAGVHDGGRLSFGPDKLLYITTGDGGNSANAQNKDSLAGKILRLKDDGSIPADNPFGNAVYSFGHRNPQGIVWDNKRQLWATEHGRSGVLSGLDEINLIKKGANYGWPNIEGDKQQAGMETPVINSGADETWAPAGLTYYKGSLFFGGLRGEALYQAKIGESNQLTLTKHFFQEFGRLRAAVIGPDSQLYISTSNTDGRGTKKSNDDKVIRINPSIFGL